MHLTTFADFEGVRLVTLGAWVGEGGEQMNGGGIFFPYRIVTFLKR